MDMFLEYVWAFLIGGAFCAVGQLLIDLTKLTPARILVSYVVAGVVLGAVGVYDPLIEFAGGRRDSSSYRLRKPPCKGSPRSRRPARPPRSFHGRLHRCGGWISAAAVFFGLLAALCLRAGQR